jgi:membrane-bound ClpP family serine protease
MHPAHAVDRGDRIGEIARYLGAISLVVVGVIHAQQYYYAYFSVVPTIGTLFLLSFVGSGVVGATLIIPVRRLGRNIGDLILALAALGGIGIALGSLVALLISEYTPLFGFMESGYRLAVVLTLIFDTLTSCLLALFVAALARSRRQRAAAASTRTGDVVSNATP